MKAILFPLAVLASVTAAQTSSACGADYIVEACLGTTKAKLAACGTTAYECQCQAYVDIITCFNNCPNDTRKHDYDGQKQIFCAYATQFPTSSPTKAAAGQNTGSPSVTPTAKSSGSGSGSGSGAGSSKGTASGTSAAPTSTNNAADLVLNAGGVLAAVAGVVAAVL